MPNDDMQNVAYCTKFFICFKFQVDQMMKKPQRKEAFSPCWCQFVSPAPKYMKASPKKLKYSNRFNNEFKKPKQ